MPSPTSGLARITIRSPRRRLDLAVPDQVPLAEILPEVLRRAGEPAADPLAPAGPLGSGNRPTPAGPFGPAGADPPSGGWSLRRPDGAVLAGGTALAHQGVRDGDVLYLVPRGVDWPEPAYDDVAEEIAAAASRHGSSWDTGATRLFALATTGFVLLAGLVSLLTVGPGWTIPALIAVAVASLLVGTGALLSRAVGDGVAGAAAAGWSLPYAAAGGALALAGGTPLRDLGAGHLLVGASALLLASVVGAVAAGYGMRVFSAGATAGLSGSVAAALALSVSSVGAAAILLVALVAGVGVAPFAAVRLGKLPVPVVSAAPADLAGEAWPEPSRLYPVVARADEFLAGTLLGVAAVAVGCVGVLAASGGIAGRLLGALGCAALLLRARLFPSVAARLPLLIAGLAGLAMVAWSAASAAGPQARLVGVALAVAAVAVLLTVAVTADRPHPRSPYLSGMAEVLDVTVVVALAPVAFAVLDLYSWARALAW